MKSENEYRGGARSFNGTVIDDSFQINLNIKWLIQIIGLAGMLVYSYYRIESKVNEIERNLAEATEQLQELVEKHIVEDQQKFADLESQNKELLKWYEREMNLNPLSWKKRKKK